MAEKNILGNKGYIIDLIGSIIGILLAIYMLIIALESTDDYTRNILFPVSIFGIVASCVVFILSISLLLDKKQNKEREKSK